MCDTINNSWGYNKNDSSYKSTRQIVQLLVKAAGYDANFLLNVGPRPDGTIQPEFVSRLKEVGDWLGKNGEAVYGTRGGPLPPRNWGVTTQKGNQIFVHVLDWKDAVLPLARLAKPVRSAKYLKDGKPVVFTLDKDTLLLRLDPEILDPSIRSSCWSSGPDVHGDEGRLHPRRRVLDGPRGVRRRKLAG
jgi:alpha-L-fucosidase